MHALSTGTSITQFNGDTYAVLIFDVLLPVEVGEESRAKMSLTFEVVSCHVTCQPTLGKLLKRLDYNSSRPLLVMHIRNNKFHQYAITPSFVPVPHSHHPRVSPLSRPFYPSPLTLIGERSTQATVCKSIRFVSMTVP
jgi:hypothetical protein